MTTYKNPVDETISGRDLQGLPQMFWKGTSSNTDIKIMMGLTTSVRNRAITSRTIVYAMLYESSLSRSLSLSFSYTCIHSYTHDYMNI